MENGAEKAEDKLLTGVARKLRELGDLRHEASVDQCRLLAPLWGDRKALSKIAEWTDASQQKLVKYAGAGAVLEAGFWDGVVKPLEWGYQLSLFRKEQWEQLFDWDGFADLTAAELGALRHIDGKLRVMGKCLEVADTVVGEGM